MNFPYEDIIHLSCPEPRGRARMPMNARAAQFAPFAALSGHDEAIRETARLTEPFREITDEERALLNERHRVLVGRLGERPMVTLTWFEPDLHKEGGRWLRRDVRVARVDEEARRLVLADGAAVPMDMVAAMEGPLFENDGPESGDGRPDGI